MLVKELTDLTVTDLWKEFKRNFRGYWQEHDKAVKAFKKRLIEEALDAEPSEWICCSPYERSSERQNQRNGYWRRWITLKDRRLEIKMPRVRSGCYESRIIPRYKQRVTDGNAGLDYYSKTKFSIIIVPLLIVIIPFSIVFAVFVE